MDRKDRTVLRGSPRFLLLAMCASLAAALPVRAVEPATTAPATSSPTEFGPCRDGRSPAAAGTAIGSSDWPMCEANCLASSRLRDRACPYRTWRCCRTGASQELRGPVWQDRDTRAHTKSPGSFRGTRSALPSKIPSVLLATAWPLEKPKAPERNERCARTTIRVEPNEALTGGC